MALEKLIPQEEVISLSENPLLSEVVRKALRKRAMRLTDKEADVLTTKLAKILKDLAGVLKESCNNP